MSSSTRLSFLGPYPLGYGLALIVMCGTIFFGYLSAPNAGIAGALGGCASALSALGLSRSRITLLAVALLLAVAQEENSLDSLIGLVYMLGAYLVMRGVSVTNSVVAASAALLPPFESALLNVLTAFATAILVPIPPLLHPSKKTQARFLGFIAALCVTAAVITATARLADARANASLITAAGLAVGAVFLGWCIERVPSSVGVQPLQLAVSGVYAGQIEIQVRDCAQAHARFEVATGRFAHRLRSPASLHSFRSIVFAPLLRSLASLPSLTLPPAPPPPLHPARHRRMDLLHSPLRGLRSRVPSSYVYCSRFLWRRSSRCPRSPCVCKLPNHRRRLS